MFLIVLHGNVTVLSCNQSVDGTYQVELEDNDSGDHEVRVFICVSIFFYLHNWFVICIEIG